MDFARQQRDPTRHLVGIIFVVLIHALVIYALMTGLARKAVEVIKKPLTATIIEEIKAPPPPPPPPKKIIEPPKPQPQVQPYVPPPDIPVPQPQAEPVITAPTTTAPTEPHVITPPAPPVVAPPAPAPPKPAVRRGIVPISREDPVYPREAIRAGISKGKVLARVNIDEKGNVTDVVIVSSDPPRVFDKAVKTALEKWRFTAEGEKYVGEIEVNFTLKDE
jgi:periplasmic protein TonB